jgi:hypothetical protein
MVLMVAGIATVITVVLNILVPRLGNAMIHGNVDPKSFLGKMKQMFEFHISDPVVSSLVTALLTFLAVLITALISKLL